MMDKSSGNRLNANVKLPAKKIVPSIFNLGCARTGYPGVYSKVSTVLDWIGQQIGKDEEADEGEHVKANSTEGNQDGGKIGRSQTSDNLDTVHSIAAEKSVTRKLIFLLTCSIIFLFIPYSY